MKKKKLENLRILLAILVGRLVIVICRVAGLGATSLPGRLALLFYPRLLTDLASRYSPLILVTGTNGKTTTANLLAHVLRASGLPVVNNSEGANMVAGLTTALLRTRQVQRQRSATRHSIAVLEVDEGSFSEVCQSLRPDVVIVSNLFRDQLDRYWEVNRLAEILRTVLAGQPQARLVLNADDPLVASLGRNRHGVVYYGAGNLSRSEFSSVAATSEGSSEKLQEQVCLDCHTPLAYRWRLYSHLGQYSCPGCGFQRPQASLELIQFGTGGEIPGSHLVLQLPKQASLSLTSPLSGFYNSYNIMAAVATATLLLGLNQEDIVSPLASYQTAAGRGQVFEVQGRHCTLLLVKNPTGLSEALQAICGSNPGKPKSFILAINDLAADGRDVSWLWDVDYAPLSACNYHRLIVSGLRALDMAIVLKYSQLDFSRVVIIPKRQNSLRVLLAEPAEVELYALCTYTNLAAFVRLLRRRGGRSPGPGYRPSLSRGA